MKELKMDKQSLVCIVCPMGCRLDLIKDDTVEKGYKILGNACKRGEDYAVEEMTNPTRMIPTTVVIEGAFLKRLPVRTSGPVPKGLIMACMKEINKVSVQAPVKMGDVIIENILNTGVDIIATRSMVVEE